MSETCHPGIAYILQLYTEEQSRVDTALTHSVCHMSKEDGMRGMELPYQLRSDWMVTCVLFLCFILVSYVLAHGKKHLEQQFKNFALSKERASLFDDTTASDVRYTLVLILQLRRQECKRSSLHHFKRAGRFPFPQNTHWPRKSAD